MKPGSWIILDKSGKAFLEIFDEKIVKCINLEKYQVVPVLEYLQEFNKKVEK